MFCKNCGKQIDDDSKFCSECGAQIKTQMPSASLPQSAIDPRSLPPIGPEKHYKLNEKTKEVLLHHHVVDSLSDIIICGGSYFPRQDSYLLIVSTKYLIFVKINDTDESLDLITKIEYDDPKVKDFYSVSSLKFNVDEDDIGFNPKKLIIYPGPKETIYREAQRMREITLGTYTNSAEAHNQQPKPIVVKNTPWPTTESPAPKPQSKRERITDNKQNGVACCPNCGSTSLSANKKGFGIGKAVVGAALTGGIGLVAGNIGAKKVWVTCLNCGHRWKM